MTTRIEPVEERRARAADVQVAGWRWREADPRGHLMVRRGWRGNSHDQPRPRAAAATTERPAMASEGHTTNHYRRCDRDGQKLGRQGQDRRRFKYRVQFIGRGGQILTEVSEPSARTVLEATKPDGVNTISCLVERFCNRSEHAMHVFCSWAWVCRAVHHLLDTGKTPLRNRHAAWLRFLSSP